MSAVLDIAHLQIKPSFAGSPWVRIIRSQMTPLAETTVMGRLERPSAARIIVAKGSVISFTGAAIVNAANTGCIGGSGVDGAINEAGGRALRQARKALPIVRAPFVRVRPRGSVCALCARARAWVRAVVRVALRSCGAVRPW